MYKRPVIIEANDLAEGIFMSSGEVFDVAGDVPEEKSNHAEVSITDSSFYDEGEDVSITTITWTIGSLDSHIDGGMKITCTFDKAVISCRCDQTEVTCESGIGTNILTLDLSPVSDTGSIILYVTGAEHIPCYLQKVSAVCYGC